VIRCIFRSRSTLFAVACWALLLLTSGCRSGTESAALQRFEFNRPEMGVPFRIVLYAPNAVAARRASDAAFARIAQLNSILSDYDPDSELSLLSRSSGQGVAVPVSNDLWRVLEAAQVLAERTDGAFDVTVGPLVNLWRRVRRQRALPKPESIADARSRTGYRNLILHAKGRSAELRLADMRLDLGAIAKGYAAQEAITVLRQCGIRSALVAGSGDMAASEAPPGQRGWRVELAPREVSNAPPARFVLLRNRALATSGDVFQYVEVEGRRYSHIVDPRTGMGLTDRSLVTVIARDGMIADALATALSVLGPQRGFEVMKAYHGAEGRVVRAPGAHVESAESEGFSKYDEHPR